MILERMPVTLAEVNSYIKDSDEKIPLHDYLKAFSNLPLEKAKKLKEEIRALNSHKIKEETIIKIVDMLPQDSEDLSKIFNDVSLSEEESQAIISIIKNY